MNENKTQESDEKRTERHGRSDRKMVDAAPSMDQLARVARSVGDEVAEYVKKRPVAALGIAAGAGFALGSVLGSRIGRVVLTAAAGYAAQELLDAALGEDGVKKLLTNELSRITQQRGAAS